MESIGVFILESIVLSILVGLISSGIFLVFLSHFRPKIGIADTIAEGISTINGKKIYRIKVINYTRDPIIDIRAQLTIMKVHREGNGAIWKSHDIPLVQSNPFIIGKFHKRETGTDYAFRFVTYEDLDKTWSDDTTQFLRFRIVCTHSVSGFIRASSKLYRLKRGSLKKGSYLKGNTFEVV